MRAVCSSLLLAFQRIMLGKRSRVTRTVIKCLNGIYLLHSLMLHVHSGNSRTLGKAIYRLNMRESCYYS